MKKNLNLPEVEAVAAKVHGAWRDEKKGQGVTTRQSPTGEELMKPYDELSEEAKESNRKLVNTVYQAIEELTPEEETQQVGAHSTL